MDCRGGNSVLQLTRRIDSSLRFGKKLENKVSPRDEASAFLYTNVPNVPNVQPTPLAIPSINLNKAASSSTCSSTSSHTHNNVNCCANNDSGYDLVREFKKINEPAPPTNNYNFTRHVPVSHRPIGFSPRTMELQQPLNLDGSFDWEREFAQIEGELGESQNVLGGTTVSCGGEREHQESVHSTSTVGYHYSSDLEEDCLNIYDYVSSKATSVHSEGNTCSAGPGLARSPSYRNPLTRDAYVFNTENKYLNSSPSAYEIACILMENNCNLSEIILAFEAALQEHEQQHMVDCWYRLGIVQLQNEQEESAMDAFQHALELEPGHLEALKLLAVSHINQGNAVEATVCLSRALELKGVTISNWPQELSILNVRETMENVLLDIPSTAINVTRDKDILTVLALFNYLLGRSDNAIKCFEKLLEQDPKDEITWNHLGATLANSKRYDTAIQVYMNTIELKPSFVRARYNLGSTLVKNGELQRGIESLLTALVMQGSPIPPIATNLESFIEHLIFTEAQGKNTIVTSLKNALLKIPDDDIELKTNIENRIRLILS